MVFGMQTDARSDRYDMSERAHQNAKSGQYLAGAELYGRSEPAIVRNLMSGGTNQSVTTELIGPPKPTKYKGRMSLQTRAHGAAPHVNSPHVSEVSHTLLEGGVLTQQRGHKEGQRSRGFAPVNTSTYANPAMTVEEVAMKGWTHGGTATRVDVKNRAN